MTQTQISRVARSKKDAAATYDRMSRWYDLLAGRSERRPREVGLGKLAVGEGEKVLEIGFGTGRCLVALAQSVGGSGGVYGIDLSQGMLDITRARVRQAGLIERVHLVRGDAANLPFAATSFDAILISFTLELFDTPEIPQVLHECQRVLHNGGRIGVVAMSKKGDGGLMMKVYEWAHRKFPRYFDCRPIFVQQALEDVEFEVVDVTQMLMWALPVEIVVAKKV